MTYDLSKQRRFSILFHAIVANKLRKIEDKTERSVAEQLFNVGIDYIDYYKIIAQNVMPNQPDFHTLMEAAKCSPQEIAILSVAFNKVHGPVPDPVCIDIDQGVSFQKG